MEEKLSSLRNEINERLEQIESTQQVSEEASERNKLRKERKMMTHNILQRARSFQALTPHKSEELLPLTSTNGDSKNEDKIDKLTNELQEMANKITHFESEISSLGKITTKVASIERDFGSMSEQQLGLKLWLEERMESALGGFDGVWKVLSDVQMKVAMIDCP